MDKGDTACGQSFKVFAEATIEAKPSEGTFHHPATGQYGETLLLLRAEDRWGRCQVYLSFLVSDKSKRDTIEHCQPVGSGVRFIQHFDCASFVLRVQGNESTVAFI